MKHIVRFTIFCALLSLQTGIVLAQESPPALVPYAPAENLLPNIEGFEDSVGNNLFTGEMRFEVPFAVPPGRRNLTPELALHYSSFKKDLVSPYGYGWDLSVSSIFRTSQHGIDTMYDRNDFAVRIAGKYSELSLVDAQSGLYMGKLGNDFTKYFLEGGRWRVQDTEGMTYYFGAAASSRQEDPADPTRVFQWMLTAAEDANGNRIEYTYFEDNGQIYLDTITYVFNGTQPLYRIALQYVQKTAAATSYQTGFPVATYFLVDRINIQEYSAGWVARRFYAFSYDSTNVAMSRLTQITPQAGAITLPPFQFTYYTEGLALNLLKTIGNGVGSELTAEYQAASVYSDGSSLPFVVQTLHKLTRKDLLANTLSTTTFSYDGAHYFYDSADVFLREYAGFHKAVATDDLGITKTYFHQSESAPDNAQSSLEGEYNDHISKKGRAYRQERYDTAGNLFQSTITKWSHVSLGNERYLVTRDRVTNLTWDGDATHRDSAEEFSYDQYGNVIQRIQWGEVAANASSGVFTDVGTDKVTGDISYALNAVANIVSLPSQETVKDQSLNKIRETKHYYDVLALGSVDKGNLTKQEQWVAGVTYTDVEKTYNNFGLVTQEKDPRNNATIYAYDAFNLYPASSTNAKNQTTQYAYDYAVGKVKTATDPNGRVFETVYDGFGRVLEEKVPDLNTPTTLVTKSTTAYTDSGMPRRVQTTKYLDGITTVDFFTYFDGFGRKVQQRKKAETANTYSVKDFTYNKLGLPAKESLPYFAAGSAYTGPTANNNLYTSFVYDALQRVKTITNVVGTTTNTYDDWKTTIIDPLSNTKDLTKDAYGRLVRADEHEGVNTYTTSYQYNGLDNLTKLTDSASNVRNFTYDGLGRRLTAQDLHAPADGTFGTWSYLYDAAGNLTQTTDPKSQVVDYTYDVLNRVFTEDYAGQTGTEITYVYDNGTNGIGRLASAATNDATTAYAYNAVGGIDTETETINSVNYVTQYDYDRQGNTTLITYPDNAQAQYTYNTAGLLEKIAKKESGEGAFADVVSNFEYAPTEKVTNKVYANGKETENTYDENALYRLSRIYTGEQGTGPLALGPELPFRTFGALLPGACSQDIVSLLQGKNAGERARTKANSIAQCRHSGTYESGKYGVQLELGEVTEIDIEGKTGIEVLARAWKGGERVGFGADGSVEWERFRIFNPPILVDDPAGAVVRDIRENGVKVGELRFREDPVEAIRQVVAHNVTLVGKDGSNITPGKVGHTVSTFFPDGDPESTSVDGMVRRIGVNETLSAIKSGAGSGAFPSDSNLSFGLLEASATSNQYQGANKGIFLFDTSSIPDVDPINSATLSLYVTTKNNGLSGGASANSVLVLTSTAPASNTDLVAGDYDIASWGSTDFGRSAQQDGITLNIYNGITLNASGLTNISKTGVSKFGTQYGWFFDNTTTGLTWASGALQNIRGSYADQVGTTQDPKLVVDHSAPEVNDPPTAPTALQAEGQTNPVNIADATPEFTAIYNDPDAGDIATDYQIQVSTASDFLTIYWDSLKTLLPTSTTQGTRTPEVSYAGSALSPSTTYYWRIKLWDDSNAEGAWSTEIATFSLAAPIALQDISFTYDAVGNITQIADFSDTGAAKTATYAYDDLHRLISAQAIENSGGGMGVLFGDASETVVLVAPGACPQNIAESLQGKHASERVVIKGRALTECSRGGEYASSKYGVRLEMSDVQTIEVNGQTGVQALARAWRGNSQLGFGTDGSVEWERFRIFNPPILVDDPNGSIVRDIVKDGVKTGELRLREDPAEAMRQVVAHAVTLVSKEGSAIDPGKVGHTVSIFFPDANPETTSGDSDVNRLGTDEPFAAIRSGAGNDSNPSAAVTSPIDLRGSLTASQYQRLSRGIFGFDTSVLADADTINFATVSFSASQKQDGLSGQSSANSAMVVTASTPADITAIAGADYGQLGSTELGRSKTQANIVVNQYEDIVLNASGVANVSKTGISKFGIRYGWDFDNTTTGLAWASNGEQAMDVRMADIAGTAQDPKLVVEHTAYVPPAQLYARTYAYDSIGNITNKSDIGAYLYQNTGYANPHAATSVNGITYTYDNNGNLTSDGVRTYTWDYRNKAASITKGVATSTYKYNHEGQRTSVSDGTATTIYPNKLYNTDGTTITKHIFDQEGNTIATVETEATITSIHYNHPDHLTGSNVVTNEAGALEQLLDYYPFGGIRLDEKAGTFDEQRKFTGQEYDTDTNLHYYVQRYYNQDIGKFTAQDSVHLLIGDEQRFKETANRGLGFHLSNPQSLNSYSYVNNNPLKYTDPDGEIFETAVDIASIGLSANDFNDALSNGSTLAVIGTGALLTYDVVAAAIPGLPSTLIGKTLFKGAKNLLRFGDNAGDALKSVPTKELHRPYLRKGVRETVESRAQRGPNGEFLDANTRAPINGKYDLGHKSGQEFRTHKNQAQNEALSQPEFNNRMNNPDLYQIENPSTNRSRRFEK